MYYIGSLLKFVVVSKGKSIEEMYHDESGSTQWYNTTTLNI